MGSRISVNGNLVPTSQLCNQQTGFKAVEVEGGQAPAAARKQLLRLQVRKHRPFRSLVRN
jgi:hypothetical protein